LGEKREGQITVRSGLEKEVRMFLKVKIIGLRHTSGTVCKEEQSREGRLGTKRKTKRG